MPGVARGVSLIVARGFSLVVLRVAAAALAFRVLSAIVGFLVNAIVPLAQREQFTVFGRTHYFWDAFARWDSGWFYGIARNGYAFTEGGRSNLAFFPAYPMSMRFVGRLMGGDQQSDYFIAGILVSWAAFALALVVLYRLAELELGDEAAALRCTMYATVFPFAFFFGVVYLGKPVPAGKRRDLLRDAAVALAARRARRRADDRHAGQRHLHAAGARRAAVAPQT